MSNDQIDTDSEADVLEIEEIEEEVYDLRDAAEKWDPEALLEAIAPKYSGEKLSYDKRSRYENLLGADFSDVMVYTGQGVDAHLEKSHAVAGQLGGSNTILMHTSLAHSPTVERELTFAHELAHVVQSQEGFHAKSEFGFGDKDSLAEQEAHAAEDAYYDKYMGGATEAYLPVDTSSIVKKAFEEYLRQVYLHNPRRNGNV